MRPGRTPARTELAWLLGAGITFVAAVLLGLVVFLYWRFDGVL